MCPKKAFRMSVGCSVAIDAPEPTLSPAHMLWSPACLLQALPSSHTPWMRLKCSPGRQDSYESPYWSSSQLNRNWASKSGEQDKRLSLDGTWTTVQDSAQLHRRRRAGDGLDSGVCLVCQSRRVQEGELFSVLGSTRKPRILSFYSVSKFMSANGFPLLKRPCAVHNGDTCT